MATICSEQIPFVAETRVTGRSVSRPQRQVAVTPSRWRTAIQGIARWMKRRQDLRDRRDAFSHLLKLDDSLLEDIGVTRMDVQRAARLPLSIDAAQALYDETRGVHGPRA